MVQVGRKNTGCAGEFRAMSEAVKKGYIVAKTNETDLLGYDFIMDDGMELYRVEVKTQDYTRKSKIDGKLFLDRITFNLARRNTNNTKYYYIHYFALFCPRFDKIAWIKKDDVGGVGSKKTIYKKDFELYYSLPRNEYLLNKENKKNKENNNNQINLF